MERPSPEAPPRTSVEEYLAAESVRSVRHELVDGYAYAMSGASEMHERIATNLLIALGIHLRGTPCRAWKGDLKVAVGADHYYPDVFVTCGPDRPEGVSRDDPVLIVEVLSKSTTRIDRHEKRMAYESLSTLKEYVLVHQDRMRVEVRTVNGGEVCTLDSPGDELSLESVGFSIPVSELHA